MKDLNLLIWLTQLGISVAVPLAGFIILGVWLHQAQGWGVWTVFAGIALGLSGAVSGLRRSLRAMGMMAKEKKEPDPIPLSFNEHD